MHQHRIGERNFMRSPCVQYRSAKGVLNELVSRRDPTAAQALTEQAAFPPL